MDSNWLNLRVYWYHLQWAYGQWLPRIRYNSRHRYHAGFKDWRPVQLYYCKWPWR